METAREKYGYKYALRELTDLKGEELEIEIELIKFEELALQKVKSIQEWERQSFGVSKRYIRNKMRSCLRSLKVLNRMIAITGKEFVLVDKRVV